MPEKSRKKSKYRRKKTKKNIKYRPVKTILFIWLGPSEKCNLSEENFNSWRRGFPRIPINIMVLESEIEKFRSFFNFIERDSNTFVLSHKELLDPLGNSESIDLLSKMMDRYSLFLVDGERSVFNESYKHFISKMNSYRNSDSVDGTEIPEPLKSGFDAYSRFKDNESFKKVSSYYSSTYAKIAVRLKDLFSFVYCIKSPRTLFLDTTTRLNRINRKVFLENRQSTKLLLPVVGEYNNEFKTDLYAIYSPPKIKISENYVNAFINITMNYLYMLPFLYIMFFTDDTLIKLPNNKIRYGEKYLKDMFNITSTMILGYVYLFFKDNGKGELLEEQLDDVKDENHLFDFKTMDELSQHLIKIQHHMMLYPNIMILEPRSLYTYFFVTGSRIGRKNSELAKKEFEGICKDIELNIVDGAHLLNEYDDTNHYFFKTPFMDEDFYAKIIDLYEYVTGINMAISHEVIMNITKMNEISSQLKDFFKKYYIVNASKEVSDKKLRNLKDWICQLLDTNYKYGFLALYAIPKLFTIKGKSSIDFPYLGLCSIYHDEDYIDNKVECINGPIDFIKTFNKSYFKPLTK